MENQPFDTTCPLTGESLSDPKKARSLYGYLVSKKAYFNFANKRQLAFFLDLLLFRIALVGIGVVLGVILPFEPESPNIELVGNILDLIFFPLFLMKDGLNGASPGKKIFGLQVLNEATQKPAGYLDSLKRNLCLVIPFVMLIVGVSLTKGKRLGDGWAKTKVIWLEHKDKLPFAATELGPHKPDQRGLWVAFFLIIIPILFILAAIIIPTLLAS